MISQTDVRTFFELQPMFPLSQWWQLLVLGLCVVLSLFFVVWMYRRDSRDLSAGLTVLLSTLRILAIVCILIYVLNPGKRSETRIVKSSKLAVLIDTSLSMGLRDHESGKAIQSGPRRIDEVIQWIESGAELEELRQDHQLTIYRFGDQAQPVPVISLSKQGSVEIESEESDGRAQTGLAKLNEQLQSSRWIGWLGIAMVLLGVCGMISWLTMQFTGKPANLRALVLCCSILGVMAGLTSFGVCDLSTPQVDLWTSLGIKPADPKQVPVQTKTSLVSASDEKETEELVQDWSKNLALNGTATELGSAIQHIVNKERGGPIAGIVVVTDGRNNSGIQPARAIAAASNAGIPIYPIGIGSTLTPKNVLVSDIQVPPKVFPSDKFLVKGMIKSFGMAGKTVRVQLVSVDEKETEAETVEEETNVRLLEDGQATMVEFNVSRQDQGKRRYIVRTDSVEGDLDPRDNQRAAIVEIVERQTKVLLMAGGPSREFRFLRNQLHRDRDVMLHVWLQSAKEGADQESDELFHSFPQTRDGLFLYDCIIAFDPDWRDLTKEQSELLERWVAEQAGGLVVIAGPVNTPEWTRRPRGDESIDLIRRLYPVSFYSQGTAQLKLGRFGGDKPFPLDFSRPGRASEFLWLGDSATDSQENWGRFEGVFGYYAVNEPKPGADILANFADPTTAVDEQLPIYLASHFYGAGRVFFQASGEMWRIRRLEVEHFQQYYTKLIRWVSQGRLLRDSTRGVLLTDRERCWMGDEVVIQAILRDPQDQPLMMPQVTATVLRPDGSSQRIELKSNKNAVRQGTFSGQFTAGSEGDYRVSLPIPASPDLEVLTTSVQANIPDLEKEQPQRNDVLLKEMAEKTRGHFYVGTKEFKSSSDNLLSPNRLIQPQDQETYLTGTIDRFFQRKLMMWLLGLLTTALAFEWTVRRLHKLA